MDNTNKDLKDQPLALLAKQLNLTDLEPEEYILTKEEEDVAIKYEVERLQQYYVWKMVNLGYNENQVMQKLKETNWDDEFDREELLRIVNGNKHQDIWHKEQRRKSKEEGEKSKKELIERCTAKYMYNLMRWTSQNNFGKKLILNDHNKHLITSLCYFLSHDEKFEKELGYSFKKGILIRGISGLGKTHLVRCLEKNDLHPILILSMIEIADQIKHEGEFEINMGDNHVVYLDDVGTEEATINHYGTKINFFKQFIETLYLKNQNKSFNRIMISTNNSFSEIEEKYGFRVRSRMKEMFNIIDVKGEDMRK